MGKARDLVESAFAELVKRHGFTAREHQYQLALLLTDLIEDGTPGAIEAPTGIGKSLACLIPAIAHGICGKKVVIATYTNVLAEQYWTKDLPLALSLFKEPLSPPPCFLIGRQNYLCLTELSKLAHNLEFSDTLPSDAARIMVAEGEMGLESEIKPILAKHGCKSKQINSVWSRSTAPPSCPARACPDYDACFYYRAREAALKSGLIITNQSVLIQHGLMTSAGNEDGGDRTGLLGSPDYVIIDEAHDFPNAAISGLEFALNRKRLELMLGMAQRLELQLHLFGQKFQAKPEGTDRMRKLEQEFELAKTELELLTPALDRDAALASTPGEWLEHPALKERFQPKTTEAAQRIVAIVRFACESFLTAYENQVRALPGATPCTESDVTRFLQSVNNQILSIRETSRGCSSILQPDEGHLGWVAREFIKPGEFSTSIRSDVINLVPSLREMIWDAAPCATMSATLATDGNFDFFKSLTGFQPHFEEILPSQFDYTTQATLYLPPADSVPDPSKSRGAEQGAYYAALAREVQAIIKAVGGRTLVLFHSRKEMEEVHRLMRLPDHLPVLIQGRGSASLVGEQFKRSVESSLFAVRSFWTGFDAPGETLSCVVLTRIPFEVPVVPTQIARMVMLSLEGKDPFQEYTVNQAKIMIRQGAGRLIRNETDSGLICLLDPRIRTKKYGDAILENLPRGMAHISDLADWHHSLTV